MAHEIREAKAQKQRSPKRLVRIEIEPAKGGGSVVTHRYERKGGDGYPSYEPEEKHVFGAGEGAKMLAHVARHAGIRQDGESEDEDNGNDSEAVKDGEK